MSGVMKKLVIGILLLITSGCGGNKPIHVQEVKTEPQPAPHASSIFEDVTEQSGLSFTYKNGEEANLFVMLESLGGGVLLIDFDNDGLHDIFLPGGGFFSGPDHHEIHGHPNRMFKNLGENKFTDVSESVGPFNLDFYTHGGAVGDYDCDGWADLLITGYGRVALYRNVAAPTGRRFQEVTFEAGLIGDPNGPKSKESGQPGEHFWSSSAAFGDLDGDGLPDLYLCQYVDWSFLDGHNPKCEGYSVEIKQDVCAPKRFNSLKHALYQNLGNGKFKNVTVEAGIVSEGEAKKNLGKGLGVLLIDIDDDRKPEIYVGNDTTDNFLYLNQSEPGKIRLVEKGLAMGVAVDNSGVPNGSMGLDGADVDGSGRPSIWVTNYENELHALYRNRVYENRTTFTHATSLFGLASIGPHFVGFGTCFSDVNRDGWEDIIISNGHVVRLPPRHNRSQRPILFMNVAKGTNRWFQDSKDLGGPYFQTTHLGRGLARGDLDNDGKLDFVSSPMNERTRIVRNVSNDKHHWLGIQLMAKNYRDFTGAKLTLELKERKLIRFAKAGGSYLSANDPRIFFGLGENEKIERLQIDWPSGEPRTQTLYSLGVDQYHRIDQKLP
jgi:enediyne biosynthesis protein E4